MTIEDTLAAILAELKTLNGRMAHIGGETAAGDAAPAKAPAKATKAQAPASAISIPATPLPPPAAPAPAGAVTYDMVKAAGLVLVGKKGRDAAVAIFGRFKGPDGQPLASAQAATPEQYPALLKAFEDAVA